MTGTVSNAGLVPLLDTSDVNLSRWASRTSLQTVFEEPLYATHHEPLHLPDNIFSFLTQEESDMSSTSLLPNNNKNNINGNESFSPSTEEEKPLKRKKHRPRHHKSTSTDFIRTSDVSQQTSCTQESKTLLSVSTMVSKTKTKCVGIKACPSRANKYSSTAASPSETLTNCPHCKACLTDVKGDGEVSNADLIKRVELLVSSYHNNDNANQNNEQVSDILSPNYVTQIKHPQFQISYLNNQQQQAPELLTHTSAINSSSPRADGVVYTAPQAPITNYRAPTTVLNNMQHQPLVEVPPISTINNFLSLRSSNPTQSVTQTTPVISSQRKLIQTTDTRQAPQASRIPTVQTTRQATKQNKPDSNNSTTYKTRVPSGTSTQSTQEKRPRSSSVGSSSVFEVDMSRPSRSEVRRTPLETDLDTVPSPFQPERYHSLVPRLELEDFTPREPSVSDHVLKLRSKLLVCNSLPGSPRSLVTSAYPERVIQNDLEVQLARFQIQINQLLLRLDAINAQESTPASRKEAERLLFESEHLFTQVEAVRSQYYQWMRDAKSNLHVPSKIPVISSAKTGCYRNAVEHLRNLVRIRTDIIKTFTPNKT